MDATGPSTSARSSPRSSSATRRSQSQRRCRAVVHGRVRVAMDDLDLAAARRRRSTRQTRIDGRAEVDRARPDRSRALLTARWRRRPRRAPPWPRRGSRVRRNVVSGVEAQRRCGGAPRPRAGGRRCGTRRAAAPRRSAGSLASCASASAARSTSSACAIVHLDLVGGLDEVFDRVLQVVRRVDHVAHAAASRRRRASSSSQHDRGRTGTGGSSRR